MKHSIKTKILCSLLSVLFVMQIVPFSTFAVEETSETPSYTVSTENGLNETPDILYEVIEKRDMYTKVYKMTDGSFCEIKSFSPVHEFVDGEWIEIRSAITDGIETLEEATQILSSGSDSASALFSLTNSEQTVSSEGSIRAFSKNEEEEDDRYYETSNLEIIDEDSAVIVYPEALDAVLGKTRIVIHAQVVMNCELNRFANDEHNYITAYEATEEIEKEQVIVYPETDPEAEPEEPTVIEKITYDVDGGYGDMIFDNVNIENAGYYIWNITELYNLWERGLAENNGVIFKAFENAGVKINGGSFSVTYREVSPIDENFSYYSFDMGRAGTVYVNEFTNEITIVRNDLGIDGNIMPVSINGLYYKNNNMSSEQYGENWSFNYNSSLKKDGYNYVWNMIGGNSLVFYKDIYYNPTTHDGYSKWLDEEKEYILYIHENNSNNYNPNYSLNYIIDKDGCKYSFYDKVFTEGAYLKSVETDDNSIVFEYNQGNLKSITDGVGRKYIFTYYEDTNGPDYLSNISVNSLVDGTTNTYEPIVIESYTNEETKVEVSYDYTLINDKPYLTTVTFPDGKSINYEYSTEGTLISISNIDGRKLTIETFSEGKIYTESVSRDYSTPDTINSLLINDKHTYLRTIEHYDDIYEKTYYNRLLKPQYYQKYAYDRTGSQIIIDERYYEYTNDGITSNLFVPESEKENEFLLNPGFESKNNKKPADWNKPTFDFDGDYKRDSSVKHSGSASLQLEGKYCEEMYVSQEFKPFSEGLSNGDFMAIGGYVMVGEAIVSPSHFCGIKVIAHCAEDTEFEVCCIPFDTNIVDEWQYIMSSFEISDSYSGKSLFHYEIRCSFDYQEGYVYFDDLKMYKTEGSYDIVIPNKQCSCEDCAYGEGCPCECENPEQCSCEECKPTVLACGCDENSNWGLGCLCSSENMSGCNCVDNKIVIDEETGLVISDGSKQMMTTQIYDSDNNYLSKTIDENGVEINYTYNPLNGLLESVENANGKTEYYYNAIGTLEKISVAVSNLSDNHTHMETNYNYLNDKISSITHNGFTYYFLYNENGDYQTVKVGNENLVSYGYDNNQQLNQITYANGDTITYTYDSNGLITEVYLNKSTNPTYQYEYNEFGELIASTDNTSGLTTKYNYTTTNADGTTTTYSIFVYRTNTDNGNDIRYYETISNDKIVENITGEEYIQSPTITNYNCETGITTSSTKTEHGGMSFVTAAATDVFGRRINTPENTSVNNESWNEIMSSSSTVLQKDYRDLIVSKAETEYFYDDSDTTAKSLVSGYRNEVSGVSYYHFETSYLPLNVNEKWENSNYSYYYVYNEYGNITEVYTYAEDGIAPDRLVYRYTYDENQNVTREDYSGNNNGAYSHTYTYCYDDNGRVTRRDDFPYTLGELGESVTPLYFIFNETDQKYYYTKYPYDSKNEYSYEYDGVGNISKVYSGLGENKSLIISYEYDAANQLIRENNKNLQKTFVYAYDAGGNLSTKTEYDYTTDAQISSSAINTINYSYDTIWKDKLISYNNKAITYDELGNPLTYGDKNSISEEYREYEWQGKQLVSCTILNKDNNPDTDVKYVYTYNGDGLRSSKISYDCDDAGTVDITSAIRTEYLWKDGKLIYLWVSPKFEANEHSEALSIKYLYDENDEPYGMITNGSNVFYFIKNLQGDIERIVTSDCKTRMITYSYDAWGNMTYEFNSSDIQTMIGSMEMLANNVVTYRGYTYDFETGLYYLQSRYYSPEWGRFLNADSYCDTETSIIGTNMFAYCDNNPVNYIDPEGFASITINVYSGGAGHADITIGSTTYAFGNYQKDTNRWHQITGKAKGYLVVATASEWLKKERTQYSVETFTISVSDSEKKSIENYCKSVQQRGSKDRYPWNDRKVGTIYKINSGAYSKYSLLTKNCVHFTVQATSSGIRSRLAALSKKVYDDPLKIFSIFLPASFRSFMYQYMANYYCVYKSYSKIK